MPKTYFHKHTQGTREETVKSKTLVCHKDVCDLESETTEHAKTRATPRQQPSNSEEAKPSLGGIERRGSVRSTDKASNSRVVPISGHKRDSAPDTEGKSEMKWKNSCNLGDQIQI